MTRNPARVKAPRLAFVPFNSTMPFNGAARPHSVRAKVLLSTPFDPHKAKNLTLVNVEIGNITCEYGCLAA